MAHRAHPQAEPLMSTNSLPAVATPKRRFDSLASLGELIGQPFLLSAGLRIDQQMIDAFGRLTGDEQWIHVDPARAAREAPSGGTIAHGFLSLSLLSRWHLDCFEYAQARVFLNYGFDRIRFTAPVPAGSLVCAAFALSKLNRVSEREARCLWKTEIRVAGLARPALVADWHIQVGF